MAVVVTAASGFDLEYVLTGVAREPEKSAGGYYMNAAQSGEAQGRWFGPGAEHLGLAGDAGWDFSWFEGRATEERPPRGYASMLGARMSALAGVPDAAPLDLQTGGGEVLASIPAGPPVLAASESWPPNIAVAARNLAKLGARVVPVENELADLPFADATFELVVSRHPVAVPWGEVARVLKPGGTYSSQESATARSAS